MIYFNCDYLEGGHPKILEKMLSTNMEQLTGYSTDHYCDSARERIRQACGCPDADVHFLVGGTQTNLTAIASILRPYQGVLAAHDGHIACHENGIPLYIDGARMGYGLTSPDADVTLQDIASLCDMFYIGGTKCGAVMGEALVITNPALKEGFRYTIKQHGGLLAKGRYLGIQFDVLFEDDLYFTICKKAVEQSMAIRRAFEEKGIQMDSDSSTNQQFPILTREQMDKLAQKYSYEIWEEYDETHTVVRFCTSWATQDQNVQQLLEDIRAL